MLGTEAFDQKSYWLRRHAQYAGDARSVGNLSLSHEQNLTGDRLFTEFLLEVIGHLAPRTILDLGCGYGRACAAFRPGTIQYLGVDVSPVALRQAREAYPAFAFEEADLVEWRPTRRYDLVLCTYTLSMFPEDAAWEKVLLAALDAVEPGGTLILHDFLPAQREQKVQHVAYRSRGDYERVFEARGFRWDPELRTRFDSRRIGGLFSREAHFIRSIARPAAEPPPSAKAEPRPDRPSPPPESEPGAERALRGAVRSRACASARRSADRGRGTRGSRPRGPRCRPPRTHGHVAASPCRGPMRLCRR